MTTNFHADIVGSYLRPPELTEAKLQNMPPEEVRPIEDRAILDILKMQEDAGLNVVTDGEYRRAYWQQGICSIMDGFALKSWNEDSPVIVPYPVDKLKWKASLVDLELKFLQEHTSKPIKITMPSPTIFLRNWVDGVSDQAYAN